MDWASKLRLETILAATILATKTNKSPEYVGTFIRFLKEPESSTFLEQWTGELTCVAELHGLAQACSLSKFIGSQYPGMPSLKPVASQMTGGDLIRFPAIALVTRPVPELKDEQKQWISALRIWTFTQLIESIYRGVAPNPYLIDVINKLRLAIDKDAQWLTLFRRLHVSTESLLGMKRDIGEMCTSLLKDTKDKITEPSHRTLLSTLRNYCQNKSPDISPDKSKPDGEGGFGNLSEYLSYRAQSVLTTGTSPKFADWSELLNNRLSSSDEEGLPKTFNFDPPNGGKTTVSINKTKKFQTPLEQERDGEGVLLSTAEDHQFLPFCWNTPSNQELSALDQWVSATLSGADPFLKLLASLVKIAVQTAYSLETVLEIEFSKSPSADWSIDLEQGILCRLSPRRDKGWQAGAGMLTWIEPIEPLNCIRLLPEIVAIIDQFRNQAYDAIHLGSIWPDTFRERPSTAFNRICKTVPGLQRLKSGMLSHALKQHAFEISGDPVLSDLVSSHSATGLGGACAYSAYTHNATQSCLDLSNTTPLEPPADAFEVQINSAGSELSPLDAALRQACTEALAKVNQLSDQPQDWPANHNALSAYVVVALLAATGGRPVTSPFESIAHFNWSIPAVYIEDKVSSKLHQGRLVPIPQWVATLIRNFYIPHLERLSVLISELDQPLSEAVLSISQYKHCDQLPLFFLLNLEPKLRWHEISEATLGALDIFSWPLPWNLMRHRLPTKLKRLGHDHEIINGFTGHGENGTEAYGPYSLRIWEVDARNSAVAMEVALAALNLQFPIPSHWPVVPIISEKNSPGKSCLNSASRFGSTARAAKRLSSHTKAANQARAEILEFVGERSIEALSSTDWETLSLNMLFNIDGRPRTLGTIRYEALKLWITENWQRNGVRPRIKRRYLPALEEKSPFTADSVNCIDRLAVALKSLQLHFEDIVPTRTSKRDALAFGILALVLESRLADKEVLSDILKNRNFRLVKFQNCYHLEHSPGLDKIDEVPVRRYSIDATTAMLLARAKTSTNSIDIRKRATSSRFLDIAESFCLDARKTQTFQSFVFAIAEHVRQANVVQYPGLVASYLNGELVSTGLDHRDWIRAVLGKSPIALPAATSKVSTETVERNEDTEDEELAPSSEVDSSYIVWPGSLVDMESKSFIGPPNIIERQTLAFDFFKAIRIALTNELENTNPSRRDLDATMRGLIRENSGKISTSCLLLGEWQRSLLWRKTKQGLIRIRSLSRYLNSLSVCFQAIAYNHDLMECDEEEVTEFYRQVMEVRQFVRPDKDQFTSGSKRPISSIDEVEAEDPAKIYRTQSLALQLLKDFHRFVSRDFGIEDPDWSGIWANAGLLSISPGMLCEAEYQCCLKALAPEPRKASRDELGRAFILLSAYRFGLRGNEVTGLLRRDWVEVDRGIVVLLVRGNRYRRLKTSAAQRRVPLVFALSQHEKNVLGDWLASFDGITSLNPDGPLFADERNPHSLMNGRLLRWQVSQAMKRVTFNPDMSLHHGRHGFCNRVALLLVSKGDQIWPFAEGVTPSGDEQRRHVRQLLLGTDQVTRRSIWAVARLLGHAHPTTSVRSYLHLLPELSALYIKIEPSQKRQISQDLASVCIDLDTVKFDDTYLRVPAFEPPTESSEPLTAYQALRFLLLCQRGVNTSRAEFITRISRYNSTRLLGAVETVDKILSQRHAINPHASGKFNLLGHISQTRWAELISRAQTLNWIVNEVDPAAIGLKDLSLMTGSSRQILLWKPVHFQFFRKILESWHISERSYLIHATQRKKDDLLKLAENSGLSLGVAPESTSKIGIDNSIVKSGKAKPESRNMDYQQIDAVMMDDPNLQIGNRCGVLAQTHLESDLRSSHELVLILLISLSLEIYAQ